MRSEKLSGSCLFIALQSTFFRLLRLGIRLAVGDVELVKPAYELHILAILIGHAVANVANETLGREQVIGQEKFRIVRNMFKQERHGL